MSFIGSHRRIIVGIVAVLTVLACDMAYDPAAAAPPSAVAFLATAATALKPAVRLAQSGQVMFPINPLPMCTISKSSFGQPRPGGRIHQGTDIMASLGQEIYAVGNGTLIKKTVDGSVDATLSGNAWRLQLSNGTGTYYFYAHLSAFAAGLNQGDLVTAGQLIGYVGDTGDAGPGNYHLHFEVHPNGGVAVDPFPLLTIPKACKIVA
jgi:murein DD-endopeptidase MepM/ murein hydrolase activator NlpD